MKKTKIKLLTSLSCAVLLTTLIPATVISASKIKDESKEFIDKNHFIDPSKYLDFKYNNDPIYRDDETFFSDNLESKKYEFENEDLTISLNPWLQDNKILQFYPLFFDFYELKKQESDYRIIKEYFLEPNIDLKDNNVEIKYKDEDELNKKMSRVVFIIANILNPFIYKNIDYLPKLHSKDIELNGHTNKIKIIKDFKYLYDFLKDDNFYDGVVDRKIYDKVFLDQNEYNTQTLNERYDELKIVWESLNHIDINLTLLGSIKKLKLLKDNNLISEEHYKNESIDLLKTNSVAIINFLTNLISYEILLSKQEKEINFNKINKKTYYLNNKIYFKNFNSSNFLNNVLNYAKKYFDSRIEYFDPNLLRVFDLFDYEFISDKIIGNPLSGFHSPRRQKNSINWNRPFFEKTYWMLEWSAFLRIPPKKEVVESTNRIDLFKNEIYQRPVKLSNMYYELFVTNILINELQKDNANNENDSEIINNLKLKKQDLLNKIKETENQINEFLANNYKYEIENNEPSDDSILKQYKKMSKNSYFIDVLDFLLEHNFNDFFELNEGDIEWKLKE